MEEIQHSHTQYNSGLVRSNQSPPNPVEISAVKIQDSRFSDESCSGRTWFLCEW